MRKKTKATKPVEDLVAFGIGSNSKDDRQQRELQITPYPLTGLLLTALSADRLLADRFLAAFPQFSRA
jgi:hypothetical protein